MKHSVLALSGCCGGRVWRAPTCPHFDSKQLQYIPLQFCMLTVSVPPAQLTTTPNPTAYTPFDDHFIARKYSSYQLNVMLPSVVRLAPGACQNTELIFSFASQFEYFFIFSQQQKKKYRLLFSCLMANIQSHTLAYLPRQKETRGGRPPKFKLRGYAYFLYILSSYIQLIEFIL